MRKSVRFGGFVLAAATATALTVAPSAYAAKTHPVLYIGVAGGSKVSAVDGTVVSGLTAQSVVNGITLPASNHNEIADGSVNGLLDAGAVTTDESATAVGSGAQLVTHAHTANVNLLGGLITLDAVDTTSTATFTGTSLSADTATTLVGLKITNVDLPITIPQNYTVRIPGVALIVLNFDSTYVAGNTAATLGAGAYIKLLGDYGNSPLGTEIYLNPTYSAMSSHIPKTNVILGGIAYGSQLSLNALNLIGLQSGPTAQLGMPADGTNGQTLTNSTAGVNIPGVLVGGAIATTANGTTTTTSGDGKLTASVAQLSLFDGLIKAKALKSTAEAKKAGSTETVKGTATLVGLVIAGQKIPINVSPNTVIDVAGLGTVTINEQEANGFAITERALDIQLSTARAGIPAGTRIELAVSAAYLLA